MLVHECVSAQRLARLEPSVGAFHTGRPTLALDLMEPFRPLVADSAPISCFNRGELTDRHFLRTAAGCGSPTPADAPSSPAWWRRMDTEVPQPVFGYRLTTAACFMLHARTLAAWMLNEVPVSPGDKGVVVI